MQYQGEFRFLGSAFCLQGRLPAPGWVVAQMKRDEQCLPAACHTGTLRDGGLSPSASSELSGLVALSAGGVAAGSQSSRLVPSPVGLAGLQHPGSGLLEGEVSPACCGVAASARKEGPPGH